MRWLLCKFGLHNWDLVGTGSLLLLNPIERCRRCGAGRMFLNFGEAVMRYSPEQMESLMKAHAEASR